MIYDTEKAAGFGERIAIRREAMGLKQMNLASLVWPECFDYEKADEKTRESKRKAIVGYEHGRQPKDAETFLKLCNVLGCELDYLAGAIDLPTRQQTDICAVTCLSPKAAGVIMSPDDKPAISTPADMALNELLCSDAGRWVLEYIGMYLIQDEKLCREGAEIPYVREHLYGIVSKLGELRHEVRTRREREWKKTPPSNDNYIMIGGADSGQH